MKKYVSAALFLVTGSAAFAAAPDGVGGLASACCTAIAACCNLLFCCG